MKTYSRLKKPTYLPSEPPAKRRRIRADSDADADADDQPAALPSSSAALLRSDAISTPRSSPPPHRTTSAAAAPPSSTPPSSPPPAPPASTSPLPLPARRRPTFSFFARRPAALTSRLPNASPTTTSSSAARAAPAGKNTQQRLTQLQLDLGTAPVQRACGVCGMTYVPSNAEDAALHKSFHAMNVGGVEVGRGFGKRGGEVVWENGDVVVGVGRRDKGAARVRVRRVLEVVEKELGAVEIGEDELWGQVVVKEGGGRDRAGVGGDEGPRPQRAAVVNAKEGNKAREETVLRADRFRAYLYVRGSKCIGLCLAERITEAYRVVPPPKDTTTLPKAPTATVPTITPPGGKTTSNGTRASGEPTAAPPPRQPVPSTTTPTAPTALTISHTSHPAHLGISRIWVSSLHRRHGVATALLDAAARDFCGQQYYGLDEYDGANKKRDRVPKELVAFSQPTDSGARLARRWFGAAEGWGVYW
ncbi:Sister chromatid cohesion acetyltransferase eco1 [Neofusicoccum parvum]|uniref:Sister chromatid cohesion acetyltransferase eco1 n=1 Tax=Neofusicoccum parvum TaxID=310453 RepID=A0ACB5RNH5_9PEZI|nr:Sister chromatid cohesion acetyltransferase eco1 [Neofusicoccum parvum]